MSKYLSLTLFLVAALLVAACGGAAPAPTAIAVTPTAGAAVEPVAAETAPPAGPTLPALYVTVDASPETCAAMKTLLAQTLGREASWGREPFVDPITGQTGTACLIGVEGSGVDWPAGPDMNAVMAGMQALGWQDRQDYAAGGPTTNLIGFGKGHELCVYTQRWQPAPGITCPQGQPIGACELAPQQRLWTNKMECVDQAPPPPAQVGLTPASGDTCAAAARLMADTLGHPSTAAGAPYEGWQIRGSAGTGCQATVAGTGAELEASYWTAVPPAMERGGWIAVWPYAAGGPSGGAIPFARGDEECVYTEQRAAAPGVVCPEGQAPFFECQVPPEQTVLTYTLNCAAAAIGDPVPASITPATAATCGATAALVADILGGEAAPGAAPFPDYYTGQSGSGCQAVATGTAEQPPDWAGLDAALQRLGWTPSADHPNSMPNSTWSGYVKGGELCLYNEAWQPGPAAACPGDRPIWECQPAPDQKLWTATLSCAIVDPPPPAYLSLIQPTGAPAQAGTCAWMEETPEEEVGSVPFVDI
jgi:hypothetical protein